MTAGLAFHVHHDQLVEFCFDYDKRVRFIKENKPPEEQELRLRLFQLIPAERIPGKDSDLWEAYYKTLGAHNKAREAYDKAYTPEITALHKELCLDCPWNGRTIFSGRRV